GRAACPDRNGACSCVGRRMMTGVDHRPPSSNLNAVLAHRLHPREPETVIAGSVPAIYLPDKVSSGPDKAMDRRAKPGNDKALLSFFPKLTPPSSSKQARAVRRSSAVHSLL